MKKILLLIGATIGVVVVAGCLINATAILTAKNNIFETEENSQVIDNEQLTEYKVSALDLPENLDFAGERVPLENPDVYERLDREMLVNTYWQSNALLLMKRANKYFPIIEPILKKNDIPDDFKYLAVIESGLIDVVSPSGASGFWQFMKAAASDFGLEVSETVDERYHLEKATEAACAYLLKAKESTGSWTMAAAAYNAGISGMNKQILFQNQTNYYDLWLNSETSRYVFRILALKEIMKSPKKYGFHFKTNQLYNESPSFLIKVEYSIENLAEFAKNYNISYKELKIYNPWLRDRKLDNPTNKTYYIKIPKK